MKELKLIMAMDQHALVGVGDVLPWHVPEELKLFQEITVGSVIIMGKNTFLGLKKFPLKKRVNVVLSKSFVGCTHEIVDGTHVYYAESLDVLDDALVHFRQHDWFVIGGPSLWDAALKTGRVTEIHQSMMNFVVAETDGAIYYDTIYDLTESGAISLDLISHEEELKFTYSHMAVNYEACPSTFNIQSKQTKRVVLPQ